MKRFYTKSNNTHMIHCGDYNWEIEDDDTYYLTISMEDTESNIILCYSDGVLKLYHSHIPIGFRFKMPFEMTSTFIKWLTKGEGCKVSGIYNPNEEPHL